MSASIMVNFRIGFATAVAKIHVVMIVVIIIRRAIRRTTTLIIINTKNEASDKSDHGNDRNRGLGIDEHSRRNNMDNSNNLGPKSM